MSISDILEKEFRTLKVVDEETRFENENDDHLKNLSQDEMDKEYNHSEDDELSDSFNEEWDTDVICEADTGTVKSLAECLKVVIQDVNQPMSVHEKYLKMWIRDQFTYVSDLYENKSNLYAFVRANLPNELAEAQRLLTKYKNINLADIKDISERTLVFEARKDRKKIQRWTDNTWKRFLGYYDKVLVRKFENGKDLNFNIIGANPNLFNMYDIERNNKRLKRIQEEEDLSRRVTLFQDLQLKAAAEQEEIMKKLEAEKILATQREIQSKILADLKHSKLISRMGNIITIIYF